MNPRLWNPTKGRHAMTRSTNELLGVLDTAGKLMKESTEALLQEDWARFFDLHDQCGKALVYAQLECGDLRILNRIAQLTDILKERREHALTLLGSSAIGDA